MKRWPVLLLLLLIGCEQEPFFTDSGTFTDSRDSRIYKSVKIGNQTWMAENLAYLPSVNPSDQDHQSDTIPYYYIYDYAGHSVYDAKETMNYKTYGVLYNWAAAKIACPIGWHLTGDGEWKTLEIQLGMNRKEADGTTYRLSGHVGMKLKSTSGWKGNGNSDGNGDNSSGLSVLPGGQRWSFSHRFVGLGQSALFWTSSGNGEKKGSDLRLYPSAWIRELAGASYDNILRKSITVNSISRWDEVASYGYSVRCIKDE